jgi:hypothetical protein
MVVLVIGIKVTMWVRVPCAIGVRMFSLAGTTEDTISERSDMRMDAAEVADDAQE